jgi:hypothetical protein
MGAPTRRWWRGAGAGGLAVALALTLLAAGARAATFTYVAAGTPLHYREGRTAPPADWTRPEATEAGWIDSPAGFGIGYGDDDDRTVLAGMRGRYLTVYARAHFAVGPERDRLKTARLRARFDDGFVAYLNGVEIARSHLPAGPVGPATRARDHEASAGAVTFDFAPALLRAGDNVFAVEVHNARLTSSDLSFIPTLEAADEPGEGAALTLGPYVQAVDRTGVTLCFETDRPAPARVLYGPTPAYGRTAVEPTPRRRHEVRLGGLTPGTTFYYRVVSAAGAGAAGQSRTEPDGTTPLRVVVFSDNRSHHGAHAAVVRGVLAARPDLVLNSGDLVGATTVAQWRNFFAIEAPLLARVMLLPALGNHEGDGVLYREKFVLPADSPGGERYYVRRFAQVAVVSLDQYRSPFAAGSAQYRWLERTLAALAADPAVHFTIVQLHHGPFSSGPHGGNRIVRRDLVPLFARYHVALVFSAHDHVYERTTRDGVHYVVSGGGGAPLHRFVGPPASAVRCSCRHYCLLEIAGDTLHYRVFTPDGRRVIDELRLRRARGLAARAHQR